MVNSVLSELGWSADNGALIYEDVRYLLIRPETLIEFQKGVEAEVGAARAGELMYAGGYAGGRLSGRRYREAFRLTEKQAVEFMCRMASEIGWGRFRLMGLDPGARRLTVEVEGSPFAAAYLSHSSNNPLPEIGVCHLIRGVLGGLLAGLFEVDVQATEKQCAALGGAGCRFEVETKR